MCFKGQVSCRFQPRLINAKGASMSGCGVTFHGGYLYGTSYSLSSLANAGEEGARTAAEACAASKSTGGAQYIAVKSSCNVSDGLPAYVPQPCYRVVKTRSAETDGPTIFQRIGTFFKNLF